MASPTFGYPSATNVYMPNSSVNQAVTADLVVNFSRNVKEFPLLEYVKLVPVKRPLGYYTRIAIGPKGNWNQLGFTRQPFSTNRYSFTTTLDQLEIDTADFAIEPMHVAMLAQQAMTWRSFLVSTTIANQNNWDSNHVSTMTAFVGGTITAATGSNPFVMKLFQKAAILISKDTLGAVRPDKLTAIMNPTTAAAIAQSQEWRDYLAQQVNSYKFLEGNMPTSAEFWNLTKQIHGIRIIIDDTVVNQGANTPADDLGANNNYTIADGVICFLGRPGDLVGGEGAKDFSTVQLFAYEEMTTESVTDTWNRLQALAVTDNIDCRVVAPASGVLIYNCLT